MIKENIQQYYIECERTIVQPVQIPKCCRLGGLEADNPICIQCEKNSLSGRSNQFQICKEMNQLLGFRVSGLTPSEVQQMADKIETN